VSAAANRRNCLEAVRNLITLSRPQPEDIARAITSLAQVITDMSDVTCRLDLQFDEPDTESPK
jgi:hypothetical protein